MCTCLGLESFHVKERRMVVHAEDGTKAPMSP